MTDTTLTQGPAASAEQPITTSTRGPADLTWLRSRRTLAAGAAGVALVFGVGGFAVGHATTGESSSSTTVGPGGQGGPGGQPGGFPGSQQNGQQPGGGQMGQVPGQQDGTSQQDGTTTQQDDATTSST